MNGAFTPKLIKNLKGALKAKHAGSALRQMEKDTAVVGNNRVDNVLAKLSDKNLALQSNGDDQEKLPDVVMEKSSGRRIYPQITSADSTKIKGAYEYLLKSDAGRQQILDNSRSSATVEEADSYNLNKLRNLAKTYGLDAIKGVRDYFGYGPKNN